MCLETVPEMCVCARTHTETETDSKIEKTTNSNKKIQIYLKKFRLGGGHVDLKMRVDFDEFVDVFGVVVGAITNDEVVLGEGEVKKDGN